jgi:hypothetical protein
MEQGTILKIDKTLKIAIAIMLIIILFEIRVYNLDNCDKCKLILEGERVSQAELVKYYFSKCLEGTKIEPEKLANKSILLNYTIKTI